MTVINTLEDFITNIAILVGNVFGIFPSEISVLLVSAFVVISALYIYRLVR